MPPFIIRLCLVILQYLPLINSKESPVSSSEGSLDRNDDGSKEDCVKYQSTFSCLYSSLKTATCIYACLKEPFSIHSIFLVLNCLGIHSCFFFRFSEERTLTPRETLRQPEFYKLWFMYLFNGQGISFISSLYKVSV